MGKGAVREQGGGIGLAAAARKVVGFARIYSCTADLSVGS